MTNDTKPNWGKWSLITVVEVQEAVALSMNFELNERTAKLPEWNEVRRSPTFQDRLFIVQRSLDRVELISSDSGPPAYWRFTLRPFAALARKFKGEVPAELLALAEPDKQEVEILNLKQQVETLTQERNKLHAQVDDLTVTLQATDSPVVERSKKSYLNIIAVLLEYISGTFPTVGKHPSFKNEAQLIALIDSKFKGIPGLSERNLQGKFPEAKQSLDKT